jgi:hypothetical protein
MQLVQHTEEAQAQEAQAQEAQAQEAQAQEAQEEDNNFLTLTNVNSRLKDQLQLFLSYYITLLHNYGSLFND